MRRTRTITALLVFSVTLLAVAPAAWAGESGGGQGWYGETNDKVITNAMFITIAFFPTIILIFSLIQWRLDKRKHAKMDAAKRRARNADWRGGW
jgi:preprotein translocase subunit SecG